MRKSPVLVVAITVIAFIAGVLPAQATVSGAAVFNCTASLPAWPTPTPTAGSCNGQASAAFFGLELLLAARPWAGAGMGPFSASFDYFEVCQTPGEPPVIGIAAGVATPTGMTWVHDFPPALGPGSIQMPFSWIRVGTAALIFTGGLAGPNSRDGNGRSDVSLSGGHTAQDFLGGVALALFAPTNPIPPGTCNTGPALSAQVLGADAETI